MAKDRVKKGFFFYFGFFLLIILAVVLIIFVVMMFMPGTSILGLEYFANSRTIRLVETTDESKTPIDFANPNNFNSVEINASYASVKVQKNHEFERDGIYIVNNSKGFVTSKNAKPFEYSMTIEDGVLKVSVKEQGAFVHFSKDVQVIFQVANENASVQPLKDKKITIKNTDGSVNIGGVDNPGHSFDIAIGSVEVQNKKGGVFVSNRAPSSYNEFKVTTTDGEISFSKAISASTLSLETGSGNINAPALSSSTVTLNTDKGKVTVGTIGGNLYSRVKDAYMTINEVRGDVDFTPSAPTFSSSVIKIKNAGGSFTAIEAKDSKFEIESIRGTAKIETSTGYISIKKGIASHSIISTVSGKIDCVVGAGAANVQVSSQKGNIDVSCENDISYATISNERGTTNVSLLNNASYALNFAYYGSTENIDETFKLDNVHLNKALGAGQELSNPMLLGNGVRRTINFKCNKTLNFSWR